MARVDIRQLAIERPQERAPTVTRPRAWFSRYVVPIGVTVAFASLVLYAMREQLLPRKPVTVVPAIVTRAEARQEGAPLFQAAGWIEPRPTPVNAPALTEGIVEQLLVVEGQAVTAGEPVAKLIDVDAKLALRRAAAARDLRAAELQSAQAALKAAKRRVENPVHLEATLAEAQAELARTETTLGGLPFQIDSAAARVEYARLNLEGKRSATGSIAGRLIQEAESNHARAAAEFEELRQRTDRLEREAEAQRRAVAAVQTQLKLLIEETRQLEEAEARCGIARATFQEAVLAVEAAELAVDRTDVRAPISGRVLQLVARPGARVMGLEAAAGQSSSTVVTLYDPSMLQVRADVRLEDVPLVQPGQPVRIETPSSPEPLLGVVLTPTSSANIQKNTLEVKVSIENPPPTVRPEMLVTATFLAPPSETGPGDAPQDYERILIPRRLVLTDEGGAFVWIATAEGTAVRKPIQLGKAGDKDLVEVADGVSATDKLIASGHGDLAPGVRIAVSAEDESIGR